VQKGSAAAVKPRARSGSTLPFTGGEDEKMHKIVDEVDRFFQSVHADIEDWKFSMEDYGDGTRIFVRFQIHINSPSSETRPGFPSAKPLSTGTADDRSVSRSVPPRGSAARAGPAVEDTLQPHAPGTASRADTDLASFVDLWRNKRNSSQGSEFHKEGAPYLDAGSEWKGRKRGVSDAPTAGAAETGPDAVGARDVVR
jgi:hypothetical protein